MQFSMTWTDLGYNAERSKHVSRITFHCDQGLELPPGSPATVVFDVETMVDDAMDADALQARMRDAAEAKIEEVRAALLENAALLMRSIASVDGAAVTVEAVAQPELPLDEVPKVTFGELEPAHQELVRNRLGPDGLTDETVIELEVLADLGIGPSADDPTARAGEG